MKPGEPPDNVYPLFSGIETTPFGATSQDSATDDGWSTTPETNVTDGDAADDRSRRRQFAGGWYSRAARMPRPAAGIALALLAGVGLASARQILQTSSTARPPQASSGHTYRAAIPAIIPARVKNAGTPPQHQPGHRLRVDRRHAINRRAPARQHHASQASAAATTARYVSTGSPQPPVAPPRAAPTAGASTPSAATSNGSVANPSQATDNPPAFGANGVLGPGHSPNG